MPKVPPPDYSRYVWPPPPDKARVRLEDIVYGRHDILAASGWQRALLGQTPAGRYDRFVKPFAAAFDASGRLLVTDTGAGALFRLDRAGKRVDVFGTSGPSPLREPLGIGVGSDGTIYVADAALKQVVAFAPDGEQVGVFGRPGELENPTDAALAPDGKSLFVTDSKAHRIVVFDRETGRKLRQFGEHGAGDSSFAFPTSVVFSDDGQLYVVDQLNGRVKILSADGGLVDQFGGLGVGFANFARPKDVAVDREGLIYVSDAAFGNVQIFAPDLGLLTFIGTNGQGPGQFNVASGVAVHGDRFAVVDQLGRRVQVFRFIVPKRAE